MTSKMAMSKVSVKKLEERLSDAKYANFIKVELCLGNLKACLEEFCDHNSKTLQTDIINQLKAMDIIQHRCICPYAYVKTAKRHQQPEMSCCQGCTQFIKQLYNYGSQHFDFAFNWRNSACKNWAELNKHWSLAKVFMTKPQNKRVLTPADTDVAGILSFMMNCSKTCMCVTDVHYIKKVLDSRNSLMHTSSLALSDLDFQTMTDHMIRLLEDLSKQSDVINDTHRKEMDVTVLKIKKIRRPTFYISAVIEYKGMDTLMHELESHNACLKEQIKYIKRDCKTLKEDKEFDYNLLQELKRLKESQQEESDTMAKLYELVKEKVEHDDGILRSMSGRIESIGGCVDEISDDLNELTELFQDIYTIRNAVLAGAAVRALKGMATGAVIGTVGGPVGVAVGAVLGGLAGAAKGGVIGAGVGAAFTSVRRLFR